MEREAVCSSPHWWATGEALSSERSPPCRVASGRYGCAVVLGVDIEEGKGISLGVASFLL